MAKATPMDKGMDAAAAAGAAEASGEAPAGSSEPQGTAPAPQAGGTGRRIQLPTEKSLIKDDLGLLITFLYGPPKIGKSTLASEYPDALFLDTEGGLNRLSVYRIGIGDWNEFLQACAEVAKNPGAFKTLVIDTVDMLSTFCSAYTNKKLGIVHESDAEWGKGWQAKKDEFMRPLAKLATMDLGLVFISHAKAEEVKTRNATFTRMVPSLTGGGKDVISKMADLILFLDFDDTEDGEKRVIRTKASRYWEAGERGTKPRLPESLDWPAGAGYATLEAAWKAGGES